MVTAKHITKQEADLKISNHTGMIESKIVSFGKTHNTHHCILWGDWKDEIDSYGNVSPNRYVLSEFYWQEEVN